MIQRFGEKLRLLRKRHRMTQKELADHLGFTARSYVSMLESGEREPSGEVVLRVSQVFGVSADRLLQDALELEDPS
jgi:HTH-type transcriptional regulator, competence development regulator